MHPRAIALEREREWRNSVRERQLCSGDVGFVTLRSSYFHIFLYNSVRGSLSKDERKVRRVGLKKFCLIIAGALQALYIHTDQRRNKGEGKFLQPPGPLGPLILETLFWSFGTPPPPVGKI